MPLSSSQFKMLMSGCMNLQGVQSSFFLASLTTLNILNQCSDSGEQAFRVTERKQLPRIVDTNLMLQD